MKCVECKHCFEKKYRKNSSMIVYDCKFTKRPYIRPNQDACYTYFAKKEDKI